MLRLNGRIIQSISGFYYVEAADAVFECKAKGNFRNKKLQPLVGDFVEIEAQENKGTIVTLLQRTSCLIRPPLANIDRLFIVSSVDRPKPNLFIIDKLSAFAIYNKIEPVIVFSKTDLSDAAEYRDIYIKAGFKTVACNIENKASLSVFEQLISGHVCAFSGNSGVGKSSILNVLLPELMLETNDISDKLGRGKHTTRSVHLYKYLDGYVADTPGFSSFDFENNREKILKDDLPYCFPEFRPFVENCKFVSSCSHINDKGCAVLAAVEQGIIPAERHLSYRRMYEEVKNIKSWE